MNHGLVGDKISTATIEHHAVLEIPNDAELLAMEIKRLKDRIAQAPVMPLEWERALKIPKRYRGKRYQELRADYAKKIQAARAAAMAGMNIIITGGIGSGKTHLAYCLTWDRLKAEAIANVQADFYDQVYVHGHPEREFLFKATEDLINELEGGGRPPWTSDAPGKQIEDLVTVRFLWLDDLGFEKRTDRSREWLSSLLDRRFRSERQTIVTTNLDLEGLSSTIDDRVTSRMIEAGVAVELNGGDFRREIHKANKDQLTLAINSQEDHG